MLLVGEHPWNLLPRFAQVKLEKTRETSNCLKILNLDMFKFNIQSSITDINLNKVFKCFIDVRNVFIVGFNHVILILLNVDEFKTCKQVKKPCSDVDALWNYLSSHSSVHTVKLGIYKQIYVSLSFHWFRIANIYNL